MLPSRSKAGRLHGARLFTLYMVIGALLLLILVAASISFGAARMSLSIAWQAVFQYNPDLNEHQIIRALRLPRTIADIVVGASLAICGAIMQGTTRNPLAYSGFMGISSGAAFGIAICLAILPGSSYITHMVYSCVGATLATSITYIIASVGGCSMTPQHLVLAGISISMLFGALTSAIIIKYRIGKDMLLWSSGFTASATWMKLAIVTPFFILEG
ncbi:iron chelate uptake ABC transporter family permease subunit [Paenibacillus cisolokensis]|uniref:FecCD family ABC transporter permease n=1 Tax=Paenibacillus cisolokensis TaxID=1658519 RepID=UPI003D275F84